MFEKKKNDFESESRQIGMLISQYLDRYKDFYDTRAARRSLEYWLNSSIDLRMRMSMAKPFANEDVLFNKHKQVKVKFIHNSGSYEDLENRINDFIKDKKVIDIQYRFGFAASRSVSIATDRVLILYEV
ncbi:MULTISPECIES: hypothetical protein [Lactobacillus]|uniref:hypothetical protein n=1 Tax=Lactobacillus TaxID=1578 RepID=UPI000CD82431|nr:MULTISPECIES: hypothetical protein [Lactobacillus]RVU73502.1 hypothetical protein EJK20_07660 [Lactobacillus xujianguonis]